MHQKGVKDVPKISHSAPMEQNGRMEVLVQKGWNPAYFIGTYFIKWERGTNDVGFQQELRRMT